MTAPNSWRDVLPVHPAAELFPMMEGAEFDALAEDIKQSGLLYPIIIWHDVAGDVQYLLDGRNRLRALLAAGIRLDEDQHFRVVGHCESTRDPYALAVSLNIHRRHLTTEQKRELIAKLLKATPEKSNRQIAETVKASHVTVGTVRAELESTGQIDQLTRTVGKDGRARRTTKGDVSKLDTRIDKGGRSQAAHNDLAWRVRDVVEAIGTIRDATEQHQLLDCLAFSIRMLLKPLLKSGSPLSSEQTKAAAEKGYENFCHLRATEADAEGEYVGHDHEWDDLCDKAAAKGLLDDVDDDTGMPKFLKRAREAAQ
ncbi:ParB N-terminal domain-containing protein [Bradyrhizobium sp. WYCCWR 12699]|uniref:ParB N-terminal domain-containing protein n=1 Tax=Bradyrhizobium sp. WYCCWR 12699 TaxID=3064203 RepID=UPI0028A519A9|nr:ParB N-terminal domain-containing protein [Bradyrhizobium sp. WYCCWR 12699]MDT4739258.1 ParB N-terminal domain-containing protein [Bradyrhizobium sp. WYCCWR 12699]